MDMSTEWVRLMLDIAQVKKVNKLKVDKETKPSLWFFQSTFEHKLRGLKIMQLIDQGLGKKTSEAIQFKPVKILGLVSQKANNLPRSPRRVTVA